MSPFFVIIAVLSAVAHGGTICPIRQHMAAADEVILSVRKDGSGQFRTVGEALERIPEGSNGTRLWTVSIGRGVYWEKITIVKTKPFVSLCGDPLDMPVIDFNGTAAEYGLFNCSTVAVESDNFVAAHIVFKNSAPPPDGKRSGAQGVAVKVSGDKAAFYKCMFLGYQDTLFDDKGRHFFQYCYIQGSVDFIFGDGRSIYQDTTIESVAMETGVITAQARDNENGSGGYVFLWCNVTGTGRILLGRAYRPWSRVVFAHTYMGSIIDQAGWSDFGEPKSDITSYYGEYANWGPGANMSGRVSYVKKLSRKEASQFLTIDYINGKSWLSPLHLNFSL